MESMPLNYEKYTFVKDWLHEQSLVQEESQHEFVEHMIHPSRPFFACEHVSLAQSISFAVREGYPEQDIVNLLSQLRTQIAVEASKAQSQAHDGSTTELSGPPLQSLSRSLSKTNSTSLLRSDKVHNVGALFKQITDDDLSNYSDDKSNPITPTKPPRQNTLCKVQKVDHCDMRSLAKELELADE